MMNLIGTRGEHVYNKQFPRPYIYLIGTNMGLYCIEAHLTDGWSRLLRQVIDMQMSKT